MQLVIDANILFSILIKGGKTEELVFEKDIILFAPEYLLEEFERYKPLLLDKTHRSEEEFENFLELLKDIITTVPNDDTEALMARAQKISPDKDDAEYFALALKLKCSIWSNDKVLKNQNHVRIYSTNDLLELFQR